MLGFEGELFRASLVASTSSCFCEMWKSGRGVAIIRWPTLNTVGFCYVLLWGTVLVSLMHSVFSLGCSWKPNIQLYCLNWIRVFSGEHFLETKLIRWRCLQTVNIVIFCKYYKSLSAIFLHLSFKDIRTDKQMSSWLICIAKISAGEYKL